MSDVMPGSDSALAASTTLVQLLTGYQVTKALYVAARLGIADQFGESPKSAEELAAATGAHAPTLVRLLHTLTAFGVFEEPEPDRFALTPVGTGLRADAANSLRDVALMWGGEDSWRTWGDLLHCVQTGESAVSHLYGAATPFAYYAEHPEVGAMMTASFSALARVTAAGVVPAYDFADAGTIVDVGGGQGQLLATILQASPATRGILFDLPEVAERAGVLLARAGVAERCAVVAGDMFADVPTRGDTYILSRVIHDWDDAKSVAILKNCRRAMRPEAKLLIIERVLPSRIDHSPAVQQAVLSDLNMLVRTGGRERTDIEHGALLSQAGFAVARIIPTSAGFSVVESRCTAEGTIE